MAFDQHTNFAFSTVQAGSGVIGSTTGTTINIVNTADLPDPASGAYNVTVWPAGVNPTRANAEIMRVTAKTSTTLTVTRAQEATAALAVIAAGYQVALAMTAKLLTDIEAVAGTGGGGGGDLVKLFAVTLSADTATLDTGAGGIAGGYSAIEILLLGRTDDTSGPVNVIVTLNADTGTNYDWQQNQSAGSTNTSSARNAVDHGWLITMDSAGSGANYATQAVFKIIGYANTTFFKTATITTSVTDSSGGNMRAGVIAGAWRSTAAVTRFTATANAGQKFKAGSMLLVYGLT